MGLPWRNWFHVMGHTYGSWLPGDPRGWRSWRHREHCDGDYKHPPPEGEHAEKLARSRRVMKREPVKLTWEQRVVVAQAMGERLVELGAEVVDLCVTKVHFHGLVRFVPLEEKKGSAMAMALLYERLRLVPGNMLEDGRDPIPRHVTGIAKKHASFALREVGLAPKGGIWAGKCKVTPVESRKHQVWIVKYIRKHEKEGGAVLSIIAPGVLKARSV